MTCDRGIDAGAYVLRALEGPEAAQFAAHLDHCAACRHEVEQLQMAVDTLPVAAPQFVPPPELKDRIMREVRAEAELLRAAGPEADRVPAPAPRRSRWRQLVTMRPAVAAALSCALLAVGVGAGVVATGGEDGPQTRTIRAQVTGSASAARAQLHVTGDRAALRVTGMPSPPSGDVYQVWFEGEDGTVRATHTLFNVRDDGHATVEIEEPVTGVRRVMVSAEPSGGSEQPTSAPTVIASLS